MNDCKSEICSLMVARINGELARERFEIIRDLDMQKGSSQGKDSGSPGDRDFLRFWAVRFIAGLGVIGGNLTE